MQKPLSSSKLGPKRYRNGKILKIMRKIQHRMSCYVIGCFVFDNFWCLILSVVLIFLC